jgi:hypothetical protein
MATDPTVLRNMLAGFPEALLPPLAVGEWVALACTFAATVAGLLFLPRRGTGTGPLSLREVLAALVAGLAGIGLVVQGGHIYLGCLCLATPALGSLFVVRWTSTLEADGARVRPWPLSLWICGVIAAPMAVLITCLARRLDCLVIANLAAISLTSGLLGVVWAVHHWQRVLGEETAGRCVSAPGLGCPTNQDAAE